MKKTASKPALTADQINQIEEFIRIGCVAAQQPASIEDRQRIGQTALDLIALIQSLNRPQG